VYYKKIHFCDTDTEVAKRIATFSESFPAYLRTIFKVHKLHSVEWKFHCQWSIRSDLEEIGRCLFQGKLREYAVETEKYHEIFQSGTLFLWRNSNLGTPPPPPLKPIRGANLITRLSSDVFVGLHDYTTSFKRNNCSSDNKSLFSVHCKSHSQTYV